MNYAEALAYIYGLSDFERGGIFRNDSEQHLLREGRLLELLGNPQQTYTSTLIAGTKGKGSTAACIESVLRASGVQTGLYTQPDLHTFRERIRVRGRLISEEEVANLLPEVRALVGQIEQEHLFNPFIPYEVTTALALLYFQRQNVQHAVLEVGIGGRLDATNIVQPLVSVIASISFDHMNVLGNTLTEIATEKAGIIKPGRVVVTSAQSIEALLAIARIAGERQARLVRVGSVADDPAQDEVEAGHLPPLSYRYQLHEQSPEGQVFTVFTPLVSVPSGGSKNESGRSSLPPEQRDLLFPKRLDGNAPGIYRDLEIPLLGQHQVENATLALATLETLRATGHPACNWDEASLRQGLRDVRWSARLEIIARQPTMIVDGAHNADSMQKLLQSLRSLFTYRRLIVVLGVNADKDLIGIIQALKDVDYVILTSAFNPRAATPERMLELFAQYAPHVELISASGSSAAMELARGMAVPDDLVCATGSLYLAAEVLRWAAAQGETRIAAGIEGVDH